MRFTCTSLLILVLLGTRASLASAGEGTPTPGLKLLQAIATAKAGKYAEARKQLDEAQKAYRLAYAAVPKAPLHWVDFNRCCEQLKGYWAIRDELTKQGLQVAALGADFQKQAALIDAQLREVAKLKQDHKQFAKELNAISTALDKAGVKDATTPVEGIQELAKQRDDSNKSALIVLAKAGVKDAKTPVEGIHILARQRDDASKEALTALAKAGVKDVKTPVEGIETLARQRDDANKDALTALNKAGIKDAKTPGEGIQKLARQRDDAGKEALTALGKAGVKDAKTPVEGIQTLARQRDNASKDTLTALAKVGIKEAKTPVEGIHKLARQRDDANKEALAALVKVGIKDAKTPVEGIHILTRQRDDASKDVLTALAKAGIKDAKTPVEGIQTLATQRDDASKDALAALAKAGVKKAKTPVEGIEILAKHNAALKKERDAALLVKGKGAKELLKRNLELTDQLARARESAETLAKQNETLKKEYDVAQRAATKARLALEKEQASTKVLARENKSLQKARDAAELTAANAQKALKKAQDNVATLEKARDAAQLAEARARKALKTEQQTVATLTTANGDLKKEVKTLTTDRDYWKGLVPPADLAQARKLYDQEDYASALAMLDRLARAKSPPAPAVLALRSVTHLRLAQRQTPMQLDDPHLRMAADDATAAIAGKAGAAGYYAAGLIAEVRGNYAKARRHFQQAVEAHAGDDADSLRYKAALERMRLRRVGAQGPRTEPQDNSAAASSPTDPLQAAVLLTLIGVQPPACTTCTDAVPCPTCPHGAITWVWLPCRMGPCGGEIWFVLPCMPPSSQAPRPQQPPTPAGPPLTPEQIERANAALRLAEQLIKRGDAEGYLLKARAYLSKREWQNGLEAYAAAMKYVLRPEYRPYASDLKALLDHRIPGAAAPAPAAVAQHSGTGQPGALSPVSVRLPSTAPAKAAALRVSVPTRLTPRVTLQPPPPLTWQQVKLVTPQFEPPQAVANPDPARAERAFLRGRNHYFARRYQQAEDALAEAVRHDSQNPLHWYFLGLTQLQRGKAGQARGSFIEGTRREEQRSGQTASINLGLERIQGNVRQILEAHRHSAED